MQLYAGNSEQFIRDTVQNQIADKLKNAWFAYYGSNPSENEVRSWRNSLRAMKDVVDQADLHDHGVLLEYQLPMSSRRIDCMVTGHDGEQVPRAVIVELKQWEACAPHEGEYVVTWIGGGNRPQLHPSVQALQYRQYLQDAHTAFYEDDAVMLDSCAYLHNYSFIADDPLRDPKYQRFTSVAPVFSQDDFEPLVTFLGQRLSLGDGMPILERVQESRYRPSKKLMDHVAGVIKGDSAYTLIDEQLVVYDHVLTAVRKSWHDRKKQVVLVQGGPGTGKSVVALNLMADLLEQGYATNYATGSKAFTETLRKIIGSRGGTMFRYFNSFRDAEPNEIDVLVADEAHRIRKKSIGMFMKKSDYPDRLQIEEILSVTKVGVFFIDDHQGVRPNEIGSSAFIRDQAQKIGADLHEFRLDVQFRCMGSDAFVNWINNTLQIERTANPIWEGNEDFDFRIFDDPHALGEAIRKRVDEGHTGRLTAGFCWPWSKPRPDGTLEEDVVIDGYRRPWNAKPNAGKLAPNVPPAHLWAYDENGMEQIGCIYTAQGFEFDYAGVIVGRDLYYDWEVHEWKGRRGESHDTVVKRSKTDFVRNVKNTYRVLFSRGLKGCYVCFQDKETRRFFQSRMSHGDGRGR